MSWERPKETCFLPEDGHKYEAKINLDKKSIKNVLILMNLLYLVAEKNILLHLWSNQ